MTPQEIELYRKVQKHRGEWRQWDHVFHPRYGFGVMADTEIINGKIAPFRAIGKKGGGA